MNEPGIASATSSPGRFVSVIIPAHNGAVTLGEQLEALRTQEYEGDWEIIVVNNNSTDHTVKVVEDYQCLMPYLRLVHADARRGRSYACNVGAQAAKGDGFIFCDVDDVVAPGWLSAFAEALKDHDLAAGVLDVDTLNQSAIWRPPPVYGAANPIFDFLPYVAGCNMGVSRRAFEAVQGFSEDFRFSQDVDISWRLQLQGYRIHDVPKALLYYRYRTTWRATWKQTVATSESQVLLYKRFRPYGMPKPSLQKTWKRYKLLFTRVPQLWRKDRKVLELWVRRLAISWGRLRGSMRYRILCL